MYTDAQMWVRTIGAKGGSAAEVEGKQTLAAAYRVFRTNAATLAQRIEADLPGLTDHSINHLDALWEVGSSLARDVILNPIEAFVFGGAILLHDVANSVAAFPNGPDDLKGLEWNDLLFAEFRRNEGRDPSPDELAADVRVFPELLLQRLRDIHADQAGVIATRGFFSRTAIGTRTVHLLEDNDLRDHLGHLIGQIASSHHWSASRVESEFGDARFPSPPNYPDGWTVDCLKIALMLRVTDAAQIDSRRAPSFAMAIRSPTGTSYLHWNFQNLLGRPVVQNEYITYHSGRPFGPQEAEAWWLCFDAIRLIQRELESADEILSRRRPFRFSARGVIGSSAPSILAKTVKVLGWTPVEAQVAISDSLSVVRRFAGQEFWGDDPRVALRELLANAVDAIRARRALSRQAHHGQITVTLHEEDDEVRWLEILDDGVGMSADLLRGPLLDFGRSYWSSPLARQEHPGLLSAGFRPTGKFGIGFFSAFLLGDNVQVVSRAHGASSSSVIQLTSESTRALLRSASRTEELSEPGTRVRIRLRVGVASKGGLLAKSRALGVLIRELHFGAKNPYRLSDLDGCLRRQIAEIAPASPVTIRSRVVLGDQATDAQTAVAADDWLTMPMDDLVERTAREVKSWGTCSNVGVLKCDGEPVARLALSTADAPVARVVVDGFATGREIPGYAGIIAGDSPNLTRSEARPIISPDVFRSWLRRTERPLGKLLDETFSSGAKYASLYLAFGLRPKRIPCFLTKGGVQSVETLASQKFGSVVKFVLPRTFEWEAPTIKAKTFAFSEVAQSKVFELDRDVVIAPVLETLSSDWEAFPRFPQSWFPGAVESLESFRQSNGKPFPWCLPLLGLEAVADYWGCSVPTLIEPLLDERGLRTQTWVNVGKLFGVPIRATALVVERPKSSGSVRSARNRK